MKVAVIGSGISGLSAAHLLSKKHRVDLFEKQDHFGGHSYTVEISGDNKNDTISIDLGFIVFNKQTYPNLINFFENLQIPFEKSDMSFSVSIKGTNIEYGGKGLKAIFANKKNILNFNFIKMLKEIILFYNKAPLLLKKNLKGETLGGYLEKSNLSKFFINYHIVPMVAAIWSMPFSKAKDIPLELFLNFFINHGLFKLKNRPQWFTVTNRSRTYVNKVVESISGEVFKNYKVQKIFRSKDNVRLLIGDEYLDYDQVVLASHADQSLRMLEEPTKEEIKILSKFKYVNNIALLHRNTNLMPDNRVAWSSWNSITKNNKTCVTYWLNKLQNIKSNNNYFLTLNPIYDLEEKDIINKVNFTHPFLNTETSKFQKELELIQGKQRTWFCGSYFGYGFHEDGLKSGLEIIKNF